MKLVVQELTKDTFAPYGTYFSVHEGYDYGTISFLPDRMLHYIGSPSLGSLCSIRLRYREIAINVTEYHDDCEEVFGGFNCDIIFHVGLLGNDGQPDLNSFRMFRLPKGYYARVKRRVLHHAGFVLDKNDVADGIVILSPSAYTIDCKVINLEIPILVESSNIALNGHDIHDLTVEEHRDWVNDGSKL